MIPSRFRFRVWFNEGVFTDDIDGKPFTLYAAHTFANVPPDEHAFGCPLLSANGDCGFVAGNHWNLYWDAFNDTEHPNRVVIEFSTGLTDKNGAEIYEGDIVRYDESIGVVEWASDDEGAAEFVVRQTSGYSPENDTNAATAFYTFYDGQQHFRWQDLEVVGNVHENPELLKGDDNV